MPLVKIEMYKGRSTETKKAILDAVHQSLVEAFRIPEGDRTQRLYELEDADFERSSNKSREFTLIEITAFQGRSREAKKKLYTLIVEKLHHQAGIAPTDVLITLHEPPLENWGVAGGRPADEVDLGFNVKV